MRGLRYILIGMVLSQAEHSPAMLSWKRAPIQFMYYHSNYLSPVPLRLTMVVAVCFPVIRNKTLQAKEIDTSETHCLVALQHPTITLHGSKISLTSTGTRDAPSVASSKFTIEFAFQNHDGRCSGQQYPRKRALRGGLGMLLL